MTDQPTPPAGDDRLRRAGKATRTVAMLVIALAVAVLAATNVYTTWIEDDPGPDINYSEEIAWFACSLKAGVNSDRTTIDGLAELARGWATCNAMYEEAAARHEQVWSSFMNN